MGNEGSTGRRPLVLGIGGLGCSIASGMETGDYTVRCMDTDMRTSEKIPDVLILGEDIVQGEGCGGNMTMGKAVFRRSMDLLRDLISDHSPVFTISSLGGGTGVPGAVEINQLLRESITPCFNFMVTGDIGGSVTSHTRALANVFLGGPLCPGSIINLDSPGMENGAGIDVKTEEKLTRAVSMIANASSHSANIMAPGAIWHIFAREMKPFSLYMMDVPTLEDMESMGPSSMKGSEGQTLMVFEFPANISNTQTGRLMDLISADPLDTHLGLTENPGRSRGFTVLSIHLSSEGTGSMNDQHLNNITREYVSDLIEEGYGMNLDRQDPLM